MLSLTRCATPKLGRRGWSTYTVLGFLGYALASVFCAVLVVVWDFTLGMRLNALLVPPLAFIVVVTVATALKGREWIVFYQTTTAAVLAVVVVSLATGTDIWRLVDTTVLGVGVFLVFGRLGCFHVACCHGRPSRHGVAYGAAHVAAGFWQRWAGRTLVPVQLFEAAGSAVLVAVGLALSARPGTAALVYGTGYAVMRFGLELWRGDPVRPFARGLSEAQWFALLTVVVCALARPAWWTVGSAVVVAVGAAVLVARRRDRELLAPLHLREIDAVCEEILTDPGHERRDTRLGVGVSFHSLPDGRIDWVLSSEHPRWSLPVARRIVGMLWREAEIIEGRTPGVVHVIVARP